MNLQSNTLILKLLLSDEESDDVFQYLKKDDIETLERDFYFLIILTLLYRILTGIYEVRCFIYLLDSIAPALQQHNH